MNIILLALPFFVGLILLEIVVDKLRGTGYFRVNDSVSSLNAGILSRVMVIFHRLIPIAVYVYVQQNYSLFIWEESWWMWIAAFILYDFCYYWYHRIAHERNLFWAAHVVHHSSEEYNLTTALRQTSGSIFNWVFYLPMAFIGFEPMVFVTVLSLNLIYQFWVHTRLIGNLGWYESIFVTPSNHRVHHAINDIYIDRNYGGVFILWDKWFGTFQAEKDDEPCVYGIRKPLKSWNPLWVNLHFYSQLFKDAWHTRKWADKLSIWLRPTGWRPADVAEKFPLETFSMAKYQKYDVPVAFWLNVYALLHLVLIIASLATYMAVSAELNILGILAFGVGIIYSCTSLGFLLENRAFATAMEQFRLIVIGTVIYAVPMHMAIKLSLLVIIIISLIMLQRKTSPVEMENSVAN